MQLFYSKIFRFIVPVFITGLILINQTCVGQIDSIINYKLQVTDTVRHADALKPLFKIPETVIKVDSSTIKTDSASTHTLTKEKDYFEGKTFLFGLSNYFFPIFRGPGFLYATNDKWFSPGSNFVHCFTTDIRLQKRLSFCSSLQLMHTGIAYRKTELVEYGNGRSYPYPHSTRYNGNSSYPMQFISFNISVGFKVFRKRYTWPVGTYSKFEVLLFLERVKYNNTKFVNYAEHQVTEGEGIYYYKNFAVAYTLGAERVLFKKYVLDYGVRVGFTPMVIPNYFYNSYLVSNMEMRLRVDSNYRLFREQLINLHLGLGFLAY